MRISDWSSDVCSSDLRDSTGAPTLDPALADALADPILVDPDLGQQANGDALRPPDRPPSGGLPPVDIAPIAPAAAPSRHARSEEHTSELQSLMRISYAVFCLKKKNTPTTAYHRHIIVTYTTQDEND